MSIFIRTLFFCFICVLQGDLLNHLKPALDKTPHHTMRNIDFIYMINLDSRSEKFAQASSELLKFDIIPYRFSAVEGWLLTPDMIAEIAVTYRPGMTPLMATTYRSEANGKPSHEYMSEYGRAYVSHCLAKGALGCALSHISVLKDAWDSGYETIWVLEDDIECLMNPHIISDLIDKLDELVGYENWDVLFTDRDSRTGVNQYVIASGAQKRPDMDCSIQERYSEKYTTNQVISKDFKKTSARFGTYSMIIRRNGIKKLLEFSLAHNLFLPYDLENYLPPNIKRFSTRFDIVTNKINAPSDIRHLSP